MPMQQRQTIVILASVPLSKIRDLEDLGTPVGHYATWLEALIPEFERQPDLDVHWIVMSKGVRRPIVRSSMGQTFHVLPRWKKSVSMLTAYCVETRRISKLIRSLNPSLVHAWGSEDVEGIAGIRSGVIPRIFTLQGCLTQIVKKDRSAHKLLRLQALFEKGIVNGYGLATAESDLAREFLRTLNPGIDARVVEYGVAKEFFDVNWSPRERPAVLFAGTMNAAKGVPELIEAFRQPELRHITLEIAGDGPLAEWAKGLDLPNVRLHGRLSRWQLIEIMKEAWCLVAPTHCDTGPSVLKEARVVGLPVVVTSAAGASSYVDETGCGRIIDHGDPAALACAVLDVTRDMEHSMMLGRRSWEQHREVFHPSHTASKFADLYRHVLNMK